MSKIRGMIRAKTTETNHDHNNNENKYKESKDNISRKSKKE